MITADYKGITQCINDPRTTMEDRFFALLMLADSYEEQGESELAQALRTLVREERYPGTILTRTKTATARVWWFKTYRRGDWGIGEALYNALENALHPCGTDMANYPTIMDAYVALAKAMIKLGVETTY